LHLASRHTAREASQVETQLHFGTPRIPALFFVHGPATVRMSSKSGRKVQKVYLKKKIQLLRASQAGGSKICGSSLSCTSNHGRLAATRAASSKRYIVTTFPVYNHQIQYLIAGGVSYPTSWIIMLGSVRPIYVYEGCTSVQRRQLCSRTRWMRSLPIAQVSCAAISKQGKVRFSRPVHLEASLRRIKLFPSRQVGVLSMLI